MNLKTVFIDCESTGTIPEKHGIIQIAGALFNDGKLLESFNIRMTPFEADKIEDEALAVNGVTREQIATYQPAINGYRQFTALLGKHIDKFDRKDKAHFIGYNANFDSDMIRAWMLKAGDPYFGSWFFYPVIDVAVLAGVHLASERHTMQNFKLQTVVSQLGIQVDIGKLHDAQEDIRVTMEVFKRFAPSFWGDFKC